MNRHQHSPSVCKALTHASAFTALSPVTPQSRIQSGSTKTQLCLSIYNILILTCVRIKLGKFPAHVNSFVLGKNAIVLCIFIRIPWRLSEDLLRRTWGPQVTACKSVSPHRPLMEQRPPVRHGHGPNASSAANNRKALSHKQFYQQTLIFLRGISLLKRTVIFWNEL